ncbi:Intraflagellar transport protein [Dirofilaria immitis]
MTSRPITARPKTSAGTRATSARLRKPSIHGSQYDVAERRPISRAAAMMSESMVPTTVSRPVSRIGSIQPSRLNSSTRNERIRSRIGGTGQGVKLITDTIQIAPCRTVTRPVTQQGLTGVRPSTRIVAGRFVVDKSYYMSLLRAQMNNLISEIDTLRGDLNKGERDRQNLLIYERRAEEEANIIRTLQGRFLDCNKIVDLINTNSELYEIEDELSKLYEQRNDAEKSLAELVKDRHMKEENIRKIENEIEEQKARNNAIFHSMNSAINDAYEELKKKNQELLKEYQMKQQVLNELNQKKEQFDEHLAKFPLKQQATVLYEQLAELEEKKLIIVDEIHAEGTPDEQREHLLQIVIRTTDEINVIQKQLDDVNEQIEQLMEESHEFDIEMENAAGEKNEKYRELKLKEMQIDEFLNSYDNLMAEEELRINEISTEIIHILTLISTNITNLCLSSQNTNLDLTELRINENVSASTLKELYVYLQKELVEMDKLEEYLKTDNNQIGERIKEIDEKMKMFGSINDLKSHMEQKHQELENRRKILEEELPKINSFYQKLMDELERMKFKLEKNDEYIKMKNTEKKWQSVEKNLDALRELAIQREMETNYEVFKKEALRLKAEYNVALIASMKLC